MTPDALHRAFAFSATNAVARSYRCRLNARPCVWPSSNSGATFFLSRGMVRVYRFVTAIMHHEHQEVALKGDGRGSAGNLVNFWQKICQRPARKKAPAALPMQVLDSFHVLVGRTRFELVTNGLKGA